MSHYELDRNAFRMYHTKGAPNNYIYWISRPINGRLKAASYLKNDIAYNFSENNAQRWDRSVLRFEKENGKYF